MVGTPVSRRVTRHRRTASFRALLAIREISRVRPADRRAEQCRLARGRCNRARAAVLRDMRDFFGLPQAQRRQRVQLPRPVQPELVILVSSDTSAEDLPPPPLQQPGFVCGDLDSSLEELPELNITREFPPPLQHQVLREAYMLLDRLRDPPHRPPTPPPEPEVNWACLEEALAECNAPLHPLVLPPQPLIVQQPEVVPHPEFVPLLYVQPPPMPQVDWAMVAYALFTIAEKEHQQRLNNPS